MPRPPYIAAHANLEDLSLFRYLTIVYESLCTLTNCLKYIARVIYGKRFSPEVSAIIYDAIYESRVRFRACVFSLIDLAYERIRAEEKPYATLD